jgi:SAM-dependent methyltransferase
MTDPGGERLEPRLASPTWAVRAPLARWLRTQAAELASGGAGYSLLDVGCGDKPYEPLFAGASPYVGFDIPGNLSAELTGSIEAIPAEDSSFDAVICIQVLEHVRDPAAAVRELHRVVKPGGRVLASTHGVFVYHPNPDDLWRWTHTGLEHLFRENGDWTSVTVSPGSGTTACVGMVAAFFIDLLLKRARLRVLGRPLVAGINLSAAAVDRAIPALRQPIPGALFANYHVEAIV